MKRKIPSRSELIAPYCISHDRKFRLKDHDPAETSSLELSKQELRGFHQEAITQIGDLQEMLYAQARWSVLLILQAMDAAGKDSLIRHVMSGVNPQGCQVFSFKQPSAEDLRHDYLWRASKLLPERGNIGIFNRSYYEEVLVVRVHPQVLDNERIPPELIGKNIWKQRFEDISAYERYLTRNGVVIRKFFLHVSKQEQKQRFLSRLDEPEKNWKFSQSDVREREHWEDYMSAYEDAISHTACEEAPWYVVPADHKWFTRLVVSAVLLETLKSLDLSFPEFDQAKRDELKAARELLIQERD